MSIVYKCDRCTCLVREKDKAYEGHTRYVNEEDWNKIDGFHLCNDCYDDFVIFMSGKEVTDE